MKKKICLSLLWCLVLTLQFFFSCTNEDEASVNIASGLETSADLLKLVDNGTFIAGELSITSDVPDVKLVWNTNEACNLDTTISSITVKNGRYILPIKWQKSISDGKFGPEGIAYKAGVQIMAGKYSKYVPLIWAEKVDTTKVMESIPATRAVESIMPRLVQIELTPTMANMNDKIGASVHVSLKNADFVVFDWSELNSDTNIDMSLLPNYITSSQFIDFKWTSNGSPTHGFTINYYVHTEGITQPGIVAYTPSGASSSTLSFKVSNLPSGNIPYIGGTYTFTFEGNYTGGVQVRSLVNGVVLSTGDIVTNKQPQIIIPNNTTNVKNITFQYKRTDGDWVSLPTSVNRTQDVYNSEYVVINGIKWARGNLLYKNGVYSFYPNQYNHSDINGYWTASKNPDYFAQNSLVTGIVRTGKWSYGDPCTKISGGQWRSPTYKEQEDMIVNQNNRVIGKYPGTNVVGMFIGRSSIPTTVNEAEGCLFLPAAGCIVEGPVPAEDYIWDGENGYYWNNDKNSISLIKCLYFSPSNSLVEMHQGLSFIGMMVRCVRKN